MWVGLGVALLDAGQADSARAVLLRAQALFPDYAGPGAPAEYLARIARDQGDLRGALEQITRVTTRSERAWARQRETSARIEKVAIKKMATAIITSRRVKASRLDLARQNFIAVRPLRRRRQ